MVFDLCRTRGGVLTGSGCPGMQPRQSIACPVCEPRKSSASSLFFLDRFLPFLQCARFLSNAHDSLDFAHDWILIIFVNFCDENWWKKENGGIPSKL